MTALQEFWCSIYNSAIQAGRSGPASKKMADDAVASIPPPPSTHLMPVYRLRNGGEHFYTISEIEKDNAISQYGYTYEGIAFYAGPTE